MNKQYIQAKRYYMPLLIAVFIVAALSLPARGQLDGARVYWPLPKNTNIVGVHAASGTMNAAWSNLEFIQPRFNVQNKLYLFTYTRHQPIFNRTTMWTLVLPAGEIKTSTSLPNELNEAFFHGIGDPGISGTINLFGAPGLKAKEYARYDLNTTVALGINTTFPLGQYDETEPVNIGSNQYKVKFSLPVIKALTAWVPGKRVALEVNPSLTWLSTISNNQGQEISQDPTLSLEAHLSRDITKKAFLSLDYSFLRFGKTTYTSKENGVVLGENAAMETHLLGMTANFVINDNLQLFLTHLQTIGSDEENVSLEGTLFKATLTWSWHAVLQRAKDFHD